MRNLTSLLSRITIIISILLCFLWLAGFGLAIGNNLSGKPSEMKFNQLAHKKETISNSKKSISIVAIGDSLTRGMGDESGKGYTGYLSDEIKSKSKKPVILQNLGINGQKSGQLLQQVKQQEVQRQMKQADYILITIGGNDLFQGGQTLLDFNPQSINKIEQSYLNNLNQILSTIRLANNKATIFFIGLYNPFIDIQNGKDTSKIVREWNYKSAEAAAKYPKTVFVPTFDLFELRVNDYLYSDKFHPNTKGYRLIAERVASLLVW